MFASDYRANARDALRGQWVMAVIVGLVAWIMGANIFSESISIRIDQEKWESMFGGSIFFELMAAVLAVLSIGLFVWAVFQFIAGGAATLGYAAFNLDIVDRVPTGAGVLFSQFYRLGAGFCLQFLRGLYIALWSLLFVIPGIVKSLSYAMAPFILVEHQGMGANEAITLSKEMMYGHRWELFCLEFSFIGWNLLAVITLGIAELWVRPYRAAALAAFYRRLCALQQNYHVS